MSNLEHREDWPEILRLKDAWTLAQIAARFQTTPAEVSAALRRVGRLRPPEDDLPPEPGDDDDAEILPEVAAALRNIRSGSKDALIASHAPLLGNSPDAEVARRAGVSVRTVASFRARHGIPGYRGPRRAPRARSPRRSRIDPFIELLGSVPDRVVAERAGVSLNAVRNYRVKRGIAAAQRDAARTDGGPAAAPAAQSQAWRVTWRTPQGEKHAVIVGADLHEVVAQAEKARMGGEVIGLQLAGTMLAV